MVENNKDFFDESTVVDTKKETDRKCPQCGGVMDFAPETGDMGCPYCGYHEEVESEDELKSASELRFEDAETYENCDWGVEKKTVICKSCGAETVYDAIEIAGECPYCGSNQVMEAFDQKTMAPGGIVPFKISKKQANEGFLKWIKRKLFTPSAAKKQAKADSFKGIYLPFWTFDTDTKTLYTARYGVNHYYTDKDGKQRVVTHWHFTSGRFNKFFNDKVAAATNKHDNELLRSINNFDTESNVEYKPEYLAGFCSERYCIGLKDAWEKDAKLAINRELAREIEMNIRVTRQASIVTNLNLKTKYDDLTYKYLLLPVWMSSFKFKGKTYNFLINGQTGKVGGRAPVSAIRVIIAILLGLIGVGALLFLFSHI